MKALSQKWVYLIVLVLAGSALAYYLKFIHQTAKPLRNLVLISIDTLRADRLGVYGYARETSPAIDKLARESTLFEQVITPAPWTLPAHVSMLTGLYPYSHGVQGIHRERIRPDTALLAEILNSKGYNTLAVTGGGYVSQVYGFNRGFDRYLESPKFAPRNHTSITISIDKALARLKTFKEDDPYFLFFHNYDVHCPYDPPPDYAGKFPSKGAADIEANHCGNPYYNNMQLTNSQSLYLSDRYDESIRAVDDAISSLLAYIKSRSDYENTVIILTSDHGEEFLEHGQIGHQNSLYRELLYVPLIIHVPHETPQRISYHANLVDIFPTVLDLLSIKDSHKVDGISLAPTVRGEIIPEKIRAFEFSELQRGMRLYSRIGDDSHLIIDQRNKSTLFFNLVQDPQEQENISLKDPERFQKNHGELLEFIQNIEKSGEKKEDNQVPADETQEQIENLKSLGYL